MRISDWSSDVCSSDLRMVGSSHKWTGLPSRSSHEGDGHATTTSPHCRRACHYGEHRVHAIAAIAGPRNKPTVAARGCSGARRAESVASDGRSEEHTSELQSLMRISYSVFCLKQKKMKKIVITI